MTKNNLDFTINEKYRHVIYGPDTQNNTRSSQKTQVVITTVDNGTGVYRERKNKKARNNRMSETLGKILLYFVPVSCI